MVTEVTGRSFFDSFSLPGHVYGSQAYHDVTPQPDEVRYFVGTKRERPHIGLIAGLRHGVWHAPYSAPFTDILINGELSLESFSEFMTEVIGRLDAPLHITLPPLFYLGTTDYAIISGVLGNMASKCIFDYDFFYPCPLIGKYHETLDHTARKNLSRATGQGFRFDAVTDIDRVYEVIRINRESHGYHLAMSAGQVRATVDAIDADLLILSLGDVDVAAALVYRANDAIAHVIYWGDVPGYSHLRPMNLLAYNVFRYYAGLGYSIVDVGPSSTDGVPNAGLCRFKRSVGCHITTRYTFIINNGIVANFS